jgi:hypothetical protein
MPLQSHKNSVTVVYLIWIPYGIELFKAFLNSYKKYPAGAEHALMLMFNGVEDDMSMTEYHNYIQQENIPYEWNKMKEGQDLQAYFYAAKMCRTNYILFMNSYSEIKTGNWLLNYLAVADKFEKVIISSTASCQSHYSNVFINHKIGWEPGKDLNYHYRKYKLFIKAIFYWRILFKPFPNPHLRTNALMINREDYLAVYPGKIVSKFQAYLFESGRRGLTSQFLKKGYQVLVVDKNGTIYKSDKWSISKTFWNYEQENLMVSDNQTRLYDNSSSEQKKKLTRLAWGKK